MDLTTYAGLQAAIANSTSSNSFTRRTDLAVLAPVFISLAEAELNTMLRTRKMVARATAVISDEYSTTPSDFLRIRSFDLRGTRVKRLLYLTNEQLVEMTTRQSTDGCGPQYFTIVGTEFRFYPAPVSPATYDAELTYWQRIPPLSNTNTSNWLLADHPHIYLFGALVQAAIYVKNTDLQDQYFSAWSLLVAALDQSDKLDDIGNTLTPIPSTVV